MAGYPVVAHVLGEVDAVPAHLGDDVLAEEDDLAGAVAHAARVGHELCAWNSLGQLLGEAFGQRGPREDGTESRIGGSGHEKDAGLSGQRGGHV